MAFGQSGLNIRKTQRRLIGLAGELVIREEHRGLVKLTSNARADDGTIEVTAVDISEGGIGILCECFLPRQCQCHIRFDRPQGEGELFAADVRVGRPEMVDRRPGYQMGLIFDERSDEFKERLGLFLELIGDL